MDVKYERNKVAMPNSQYGCLPECLSCRERAVWTQERILMELKENDTMKDILSSIQAQDKPVYILVKSGKTFQGTIQKVGRNCISLKLIGDHSFFDAIIRIEEIAVVEVQVRG